MPQDDALSAAVSDVHEALLVASDGSAKVSEETLRAALSLLLHGTDAGEFFQGFHSLFGAPVSQVEVRSDEIVDLAELSHALSQRYGGRSVRFTVVEPVGMGRPARYVANLTDHSRSNRLVAEEIDGKVVLHNAP